MEHKNFEHKKEQWIKNNEQQYSEEIREVHGEASVIASYGKVKGMTEEQFEAATKLENMLFKRIEEAIQEDTNELYMEIAELHKRWLSFYWPQYTKLAHKALAAMYMADKRFTHYYDSRLGEGATRLLHDAIEQYCAEC